MSSGRWRKIFIELVVGEKDPFRDFKARFMGKKKLSLTVFAFCFCLCNSGTRRAKFVSHFMFPAHADCFFIFKGKVEVFILLFVSITMMILTTATR